MITYYAYYSNFQCYHIQTEFDAVKDEYELVRRKAKQQLKAAQKGTETPEGADLSDEYKEVSKSVYSGQIETKCTVYFLEVYVQYGKITLFSSDRLQYNCKRKVVQAAVIIFLNYEIFSTTFEFC